MFRISVRFFATALAVLAVLCPPWREVYRVRGDFWRASDAGFWPVFFPPAPTMADRYETYTIELDVGRAVITIGGAILLAVVTFFVTRSRTKP